MPRALLLAVALLMPALRANAQTDLKIVEYVIPTPRSMPHSIAAAPDGRIYFSELAANKIGVFDPRIGQFAEAVAPTPRSQPHGVAVEPRTGMVYVTQLAGGKLMQYKAPSEITYNRAHKIGMFDPAINAFTEMDTVSPASEPYAIAVDRDDNVWYSEFTTDQIVRYDPRTNQSIVFKTPIAQAQVRFLTLAPDGSIWYANFGNSRIGRIGR